MKTDERDLEFAPDLLRVQRQLPSPLPSAVMYTMLCLLGLIALWAYFGRLDIVATAHGKIVPQSFLKILQPSEPGVVREILVRDGDTVVAGQVLMRMDRQIAAAERRVIESELGYRILQVRRIEAELSGVPLERQAADDRIQFDQMEALLHARIQAQRDAVNAERASLTKAEGELSSAREIENKLRQTGPIFQAQAQGWDQLAREGFASRLLALDRQRQHVDSVQDQRAQLHQVESLKASVDQSAARLLQVQSNYRRQLHDERADALAHRHRLQQELDKILHRAEALELRAPQTGVVKDLATHTPGTVVAPGTILLTLVPRDDPLLAEVWIGNADAALVASKQKVRLKVAAYPFQKHGMLDGTVQQISADASENAGGGNALKSLQDGAYRTLVTLESSHLQSAGDRLPLISGMRVTAEIHLGTRTVLEYLLSPIQKLVHDSGREP